MTIIPTCFFRQHRKAKCFSRYSSTKKVFPGYKNKKFKKSKNWHFSKRVNPSLWSNLRQYRPGKCLSRYFTTKKTPFYALKTRSSKSRKLDIFSKGLKHRFGPKMAIFPNSFFRQYRPRKCLSRYFTTKKLLSTL